MALDNESSILNNSKNYKKNSLSKLVVTTIKQTTVMCFEDNEYNSEGNCVVNECQESNSLSEIHGTT